MPRGAVGMPRLDGKAMSPFLAEHVILDTGIRSAQTAGKRRPGECFSHSCREQTFGMLNDIRSRAGAAGAVT
jgi:hypothetical protein